MDPEVRQLGEGRWAMWALPALDGDGYDHPGHQRFAQAHSQREKPVPVLVCEDPAGAYWGWMANNDDQPSMIYHNRSAFRMCFAYGPEAEEQHGNGRIVRLTVTARDVS